MTIHFVQACARFRTKVSTFLCLDVDHLPRHPAVNDHVGAGHETALAEREELTGRKALLQGALSSLNERERHILIERRLKDNPTTLEDLSQQYNISRERVRQIEVRAFEKLQKAMHTQVAEQRKAAMAMA